MELVMHSNSLTSFKPSIASASGSPSITEPINTPLSTTTSTPPSARSLTAITKKSEVGAEYISQLGDRLLSTIALFLRLNEVAAFSVASTRIQTKLFFPALHKIKAEKTNGGAIDYLTALTLYRNPGNRKDCDVPTDSAGLSYLEGLGVSYPQTEYIRQGSRTIQQVMTSRDRHLAEIASLDKNDPASIYLIYELSHHQSLRDHILNERCDIQTLKGMRHQEIDNISIPVLQPYIRAGKLNLSDVRLMSARLTFLLKHADETIKELLLRQNPQKIITWTNEKVDAFELCMPWIRSGELSLTQAFGLTEVQLDTLDHPLLRNDLLTGKLALNEALELSETDREQRYPELTELQKSAISATSAYRSMFSFEITLSLKEYQVDALDSFDIQFQLGQGLLTAAQFLEMSEPELSEVSDKVSV